MKLAVQVHAMNRSGHRLDRRRGISRQERIGETISQRASRNVFEHQEEPVISLANVIKRDDM